jgi:glycosyltransferase involved in cell wall biosynthesis
MNSGIRIPVATHSTPYHLPLPHALRVVHFVVDDSQPLQTAVAQLVQAANSNHQLDALLVLDRNANLHHDHHWHSEGIAFKQLSSWSSIGRGYEFYRLCREYQPDAVFIHARNNNNWCRTACARAGVKHIIAVNQDAEATIPYGIALEQFAKADEVPLGLRIPGIIMPSGFSGPFHLQLIRALACLREKRLYPRVFLTGTGKRRDQLAAQQLGTALGLDNQIRIAEHCSNLPFLLMHHQIAIIGNPEQHQLHIAQAMAAGCATIGITDNTANTGSLIQQERDGLLLASDSPEVLAEKLERLLRNSAQAQQLARKARLRALEDFSLTRMQMAYQQIYHRLTTGFIIANSAA